MLRHINPLISPDLMKVLMEMGHGDEIVFADRNFPAASNAKRLLRYDAIATLPLLEAVLEYFPIDYAVPKPVALMRIPPETGCSDELHRQYQQMADRFYGAPTGIEWHARQDFYDRAARAYAIVATGEAARFSTIIIRKGVVVAD